MQSVLITGGAGFIGSHLCGKLLSKGYRVICIDNFITSNGKNIEKYSNNSNFLFIKHDVIKPLDLSEKIDYIFHLASPASPNHHSPISYHALPLETMLVNTQGTLELLKLAEKNKARFLFSSTSEVYGDPLEHPQKEEYKGNVSTTGPRSVYDEAKRFGETLTAYYGREREVDVRIARIFNTYGPGMMKEDMRMIVIFITQALEGKPITIFGDGNQTRSLCYVDDMVEGLMRLMFEQAKGEIVNLGSSSEHTIMHYANLVKKITGSNSEIILSERLPQDDPQKRRADIDKAKKLLRWEPKIDIEEGIKKTVEYFRNL